MSNTKKIIVGLVPRIINDEIEFLFVSAKRDFGKFTGLFYPPGGHLEQDESEDIALEREIEEELGIRVGVLEKLAETLGDIPNQLVSWYLCDFIEENTKLEIDDIEIDKVIWVKENEIRNKKDIFWPATYKFLDNYLTQKSSQHPPR